MEREKRNNFQRVLVYHYHHDAAVFAADIGVTHNLASIVVDSTEKFYGLSAKHFVHSFRCWNESWNLVGYHRDSIKQIHLPRVYAKRTNRNKNYNSTGSLKSIIEKSPHSHLWWFITMPEPKTENCFFFSSSPNEENQAARRCLDTIRFLKLKIISNCWVSVETLKPKIFDTLYGQFRSTCYMKEESVIGRKHSWVRCFFRFGDLL